VILVDQLNFFKNRTIGYARDIVQSRRLILDLTKREFLSRHLGSALGLLWAFVHPAILMTIYYMVFNFALHPADIRGKPFLLWLLAGLVPWFVISEIIGGGASSITDNRFLVKKVVFRVALLPIVRLLSNLPVHFFLVLILAGIFWSYGIGPTWYSVQTLYYMCAMMVRALGWALLMSAVVPFLKDIGQIVQVILQLGFWGTPLIWNMDTLGRSWMYVVACLNPISYIVQGYRESLVYHVPFWHHPLIGAYYWTVTLAMLAIGGMVFSRLRPHFADVL